ncbi:MAG: dephospho-CoA kinase [Candidatus Marinimicrobia bacterium]|nr:dephospho-CoA kinase [Candidatus Neomarinimicrobiota bacterium]|tara:strand:+ start:4227 stop:4820 length:594 start_codon:yes stop_codon:yes gene_type:complete
MLKVGLTGGMGSGKSVVSTFFKDWGAYIFDADTIAKNILNTNKIAQNEIIAEFGTDVIDINGNINKKKLGRVAFLNDNNQLKLNTIIHPYVFEEIDLCFQSVLQKGAHKIFVVDAALIYESGADAHMDYVLVVTSHLKLRTERVMNRGGISREDFLKRIDLQWSEKDKVEMADYVIHNNSTKEELKKEVKNIYKLLV